MADQTISINFVRPDGTRTTLNVPQNATVGVALDAAGVRIQDVSVSVNRVAASADKPLAPNDTVFTSPSKVSGN